MQQIKELANETPISKAVFKALADKQRQRSRTDISRLYRAIKAAEMPHLDEKQFLEVFKKLQLAGVGSLIIGRKNNPNRFAWNYNLKDIGKAAKNGNVELTPVDKQVKHVKRRVRASQTTARTIQANPIISINIQLPAGTPQTEIDAWLGLLKDLKPK